MVDSIKRAATPKPVEPTPAPQPAAAPTVSAPSAATTSSFTSAAEAPVSLTVPQEQVTSGTAIRTGSADTLASKLRSVSLTGDVKKDLSALMSSAVQGPRASNDPDNQAVTGEMTPDERKQYDRLSEEDRAAFNEAHLAAQAAEDPAEVEKLETALAAGSMPEYLDLPAEEKERVDQLLAETENLPPEQQREARAQVANLVKEGKVDEYLKVEQSSSEDANLQALLFGGQLNGMAEQDGSTMLDYLAGVASGEGETTGQGLNRGELIDQIVNDVKEHEYNQPEGNRDCLALAAVSEFARRNPATYARMMTELAETGTTTLTNAEGESIELKFNGPPNDGELTSTQEMFVESFADYIDRNFGGNGGSGLGAIFGRVADMFDGMTSREAAELLDFAHGQDYEAMTIPEDDEIDPNNPADVELQERLRQEAKDTIQEQLDAGEKPLVNIDGHWVQVEKAIELPGGTTLYVIDDGTGKKTFATDSQVDAVVYNTEHSDVPEGSYNSEWDDPGTGLKPGQGIGGDD